MRRALLVLTTMLATTAVAEPVTVRARAFDGLRWHDALEVAFEDGVVSAARASTSPPDVAGAVLTPGFIDLDARFGLGGADEELPEAIATDLRLADAFAPGDAEALALRSSGVTSAWLLGGPAVVAGGAGAVVQPSPAGRPPRVLKASWGLSASLASAARLDERAPTSLPDQASALQSVLGEIPGPARIRFDDGASARHAARLGVPVGIPQREADLAEMGDAAAMIASTDWAAVSADQLAVLVAWMRPGRDLPAWVRSKGHAGWLGFGSGSTESGPSAVRLAAARLVEEGADPDVVLRSLTSRGAEILGDPARGRIAVGAAADLVLWSGDPLSLTSRPLRAWVAGEEVFHAE